MLYKMICLSSLTNFTFLSPSIPSLVNPQIYNAFEGSDLFSLSSTSHSKQNDGLVAFFLCSFSLLNLVLFISRISAFDYSISKGNDSLRIDFRILIEFCYLIWKRKDQLVLEVVECCLLQLISLGLALWGALFLHSAALGVNAGNVEIGSVWTNSLIWVGAAQP